MLSKNDPEVPSIRSAFQRLSTAAGALNSQSDRLSKIVSELETSLKKLNVGLVRWINISSPSTSLDSMERYYEQLGYIKIGGKWVLALRTVTEYVQTPDENDYEQWPFSDAPRQLRLKAVAFIPKLLQALAEEAEKFAQSIADKADMAQRLVMDLNREDDTATFPSDLDQLKPLSSLSSSSSATALDALADLTPADPLKGVDLSAFSAATDAVLKGMDMSNMPTAADIAGPGITAIAVTPNLKHARRKI
jgi:hypothetical protein